MRNHQNQLFSGTKSKYFKFKSRLEKNISSGRFDSLSRRKKNSLIRKIEKFRLRLENLSFSRSAAVAGSLAAGMALPNLASAQNPDYRRGSNALPLPLDARNVAIANIDGDSDLEIIVSTVSGGYIINGNDTDGFTATNPAELVEMTGEFEVGDVDGDGNLDLVYHDGIRFEAAINDGTGNFGAPTQLYMMSSPYTDFKLADFDSDGDQDILFVENTRGINHSLNNGSGTFSAFSYMGLGSQPLQSIELADLDGDGDMDLVAATYGNGSTNYAGRLPVFENSAGAGNIPVLGDGYSAVFNYYLGYTVQADNIEILDFDNDGDLDIFFNQAGTNTLYFAENNYVGSSIGMYFSTLGIPTVGNSVNTVTSFDFENDGNEDLLITNGGETSLFESDGVGFIKKNLNGTYGNMSQNFSDIVAGDIDVDGFPDIIGVNTATNYVYSDRAGAQGIAITYKEFSERTAPASQKIGDLIITDVDGNIMGGETIGFTTGDGSNDADNGSFSIVGSEIFVGASDLDHETQALFNILINVSGGGLSRDIPLVLRLEDTPETGAGTFESLAAVNNARMQNAILADLDGDGDNELLYKSSGGYSNILLEDDLTDNSGIVVADAGMFIVADFDNDGDLDIIGGEGYDLEVYYNDGAGNFSFGFRETLNGYIYDIAIADFDQDGDNDVAVATYNGGQAYRNNGDQTIIYFSSIAILSTYTHRVEVGDFDNDGLTDIVFGSYDDNYIFQNAGGGSFSQISSYYFYNTRKSEVADFDGDGDLDLLILDYDDINLLRGDGTGSFTEYNTGVANVNNNTDLVVGDMDADNDLDVAFIVDNQYGGEEVRVYLNDGSNYFSPGQDFPVEEADEYGFFRGLVLGDVDGDDDLDLIVSGGEYRQVLVNDNIAPYITGFTGRVIVDENTLSGTPLGQLIVTDPNGDAVSNIAFSSGTNDNDFFLMDGLGNLTLNADLDWEQMGSSLLMEILVEDDQGNSRIEQGKLKVRNLPEDGNGTFDTKGIPLFGSQDAYAFEPGDYDMDGDQDLFKSTYNEGRDLMDTGFPASIFQQNAGSFSDEPVQSISYTKYNMIFLDSDNDGDLDILAYGYDLIRTSNNDGEFSNNNSIISSGIDEVPNMIAGDFDRDGLLEVAVQFIDFSPKYETRVEIFEIQEGGEFTPDQAFQMNYNSGGILDAIGTATDIAVADFNGNGYDDLLVATEDGDDVLFAGSASGFSYSYTSVITEADNGFNKIEAGDFDGNGSPDIAILRFGPSNNDLFLDVHLNDGAGNLSLNQTIPLGGEYSGDIKLGDVDGDGSLDIVTASYSFGNYHTDIDIHINDGAGTFTLGQNIYNVGGEEFKLMDVDGDDDLDVVVRTDSNYKGGARKLIAYKNINVSPTAINLSVASFDEHLAPDTEVATLSVDDLNVGDTHVISLVTGDGSNDLHNSFFSINGNSLRITKDVRFETHPSLNFYLSVYDGYQTFEQAMVLTVNDVNVAPTGINLSMNSFDEGTPPGTQVSTLSAIDANTGDTHTFDFATGDGTNDADNGSFIINGDRLIITDETVFEAKSVYNIYVSATDIDNSVEQALVLTINDVDQIPTGILLSSTSFDEGLAPGSEIATISAIDPNIGDNHFFEFASGDGSNDADNGSFIINGDKLVITTETQFELKSIYNIYLTAIDDDGSVEQAFVLNVNDINQAPTGIQLSSSTFDEGTAPGTTIATLTAIDANVGDNHTFSLASGDGSNDADNASFSVVGNQLKVTVNSSFETQSSYNVYLSVADDQGSFEQAFVLTVNDINQAPTGIMLSSSAFDEGTVPGTVIATLTAVDANVGDTHTFSFASGDGSNDADNESFAIVGNQLKVTVNSSFETQPSYNVYLSVEDGEGSFEQAFVLTVNDINQAPTGIMLSSSSFNEGTSPGTTIATLTAVDANIGDSHTFALATGDGSNDADNGSFTVVGNQLKVTVNSSFETQPSYNVYLSVEDGEGSFEQAFVLTVNDINQAPTGIMLSSSSFNEGTSPGTTIATLTAVDANVGDSHTFALASGDGSNDADNGSFIVVGNELKVNVNSSFETQPSYNVYLSVADGEGSFEQAFVLTVNDSNQPPTGINLTAISFNEGTTPGTTIATITADDINGGDTHTFSLAAGDGSNDADNGSFIVVGNSLIINTISRFETQSSYNIYLSSADDQGSFEQAFLIGVNDVNQAPTAIELSASSLDEGTSAGTTVATISVTDPNAGDSHTLSLASGDGSNDANNNLFVIAGNNLILVGNVNFNTNQTLSILIAASDGEETFEQAFTLNVNDVLGLAEELSNELGIYPNPGNDRLEINLDNDETGQMVIKISDLAGRVIHTYASEKNENKWTDRIDMTSAEPGIYIVEVAFETKKFIQRWIKE